VSADVLLRGGHVVDGTGREPYRADVGVVGGQVAWVAEAEQCGPDAGTVVDTTGRYVFPGFVDTHSHADGTWHRPDVQAALLRQGVTTVIIGQDGLGYAPGTAEALAASEEYFGVLDGSLPADLRGGASVADLLTLVEGHSPVNVAALVPLGLVWLGAAGPAAAEIDDDRLAAMVRTVEGGLADGAVGVSSGLEYAPNSFAGIRELAALCGPAASAALPHVTHMRGYELAADRAFAEVAQVSRLSGVRLHVSHFRGPAASLGALADRASADGIDLTYDSYPYVRGCTILSMRVLPPDVARGGRRAVLDRLASRRVRSELIRQWQDSGRESELAALQVASASNAEWAWTEGQTLAKCAASLGRTVPATVLELLVGCQLQVSVVTPPSTASDENDMRTLLRRSEHTGGSDGIYIGSAPHPRAWGTFARLLGRHVRELGDWTWGQAAVHLAARACARFGLLDRGVIRAGAVADLAVIDPARVQEEASYASPRRPAVGIDDVLVAGVPVLATGKLTGLMPGAGLRPGAMR
jgi:N-acyl-D-amino-acid deacylase